MTETNDIVIRDLAKRFQDKIVLADFNAVFAHQAVSCVMGPSGCGKTTLLNLIMGFEKPDQGTITGVPVRISAVFQEDRLLEGFSAVRNVAFAAPRMPRERIVEILSALGLGQDLNKPVREYSGGMFDGRLEKKDGRYIAHLADAAVELSEEKQKRLAAKGIDSCGIVLGVRPEHIELKQKDGAMFTTTFGNFFAIRDNHIQAINAAQLNRDDVVLYFSYSGATRDLLDILPIVQKRKATSILITRFPNSPGAALADVILQCGSNENPLQLGSAEARVAQIYLLDVLLSEMCRRDVKACEKRREDIAAALSAKHI